MVGALFLSRVSDTSHNVSRNWFSKQEIAYNTLQVNFNSGNSYKVAPCKNLKNTNSMVLVGTKAS